MPALNIIAIHETVRNSGASSSRPSGILPRLLNASHSANTTNPLATSTNAQPPAFMRPASTAEETVLSVSTDAAPQMMNATTRPAAIPKIHQSIGWRCSAAVVSDGGSTGGAVSSLLGVS